MSREDIDYLIIHQGNYRILEAGAKFARMPMDKVFVNINRYGNTSAASCPSLCTRRSPKANISEATRCPHQFRSRATWGRRCWMVDRRQ